MSANPGFLVSCQWLKNELDKGSPKSLIVLDVSWDKEKNCQDDYTKQHIPGAKYFNILDAEHTDRFPRNLPKKEVFENKARAAGISQDAHVVVYSESNACGWYMSARGWWTFKIFGHENVSVLDGGLAKWKSCNYMLTDKITPAHEPGKFKAIWDGTLYRSYEEVLNNLKTKKFQVVDCRGAALFKGEKDSLGHLEGAFNIPLANVVDQDKIQLKSVEELKDVFCKAGVELNKPTIFHCFAGLASCGVAMAAMLCGCKDVGIYYGGYAELKNQAPHLLIK